MSFERIICWLKGKIQYRHPSTFIEELSCQCRLMIYPQIFMFLFNWLLFIPLDVKMYPHIPSIVYYRIGLTFFGILIALFNFLPFLDFKKTFWTKYKSYIIYLSGLVYLEVVTAIILGLVKADVAYMGGYCLIILLIPISPLKIVHSLALLGVTQVTFFTVGYFNGMVFRSPSQVYGLLNYILAIMVCLLATFFLGLVRRHSHATNLIVQKNADKKLDEFFQAKGVSKREAEIIRLIMDGNTNTEIEQQLFISLTTVKTHIYKAYQKMGVKTRVQLLNLLQNVKMEG